MLTPAMIDTSSPEAQFASKLRQWLTLYGQAASAAAQSVNVAYAREYLTAGGWPTEGAAGLSQADLNATIDLMNEFVAEYGDDDRTLVDRLRTDV
jgi:hypothetical protein